MKHVIINTIVLQPNLSSQKELLLKVMVYDNFLFEKIKTTDIKHLVLIDIHSLIKQL